MKYVFLEIILCAFVIFCCSVGPENEEIQSVFNEADDSNSYEFVTIHTSGLSTKNFYQYFENTNFIKIIYPKVNPLYQNKVGNVSYSCEQCNISEVDRFYKDYLYNQGYKKDSIIIDYYGVEIEKIAFYINRENLNNILENCSLCIA